MNETETTRHPSFGMISFSKVMSSHSAYLFGSSIPHRNFISMRINKAALMRNCHRDWYLSEDLILEIDLSMTQFADAITSLNTDGVPCTITFMDHHMVEGKTVKNKRMQFDEEFKDFSKMLADKDNEYYTKIAKILSKNHIGKHDREEIMKQLDLLHAQIENNLPFLKKQFTEQMDKTVLESKNEFDAFVNSKLQSVGLMEFKKQLLQLTDQTEEK